MSTISKASLVREPQKGPRRGPKLREATLEDHAQVASLESRYGLASKSYEEWAYLHLNNPQQPEPHSAAPIGWVIEDGDKQIVGSVGNISLLYEFQGRKIRAVSGRALVADPAYRSTSLLLLDRLINQPGVELFLTNAITPASTAAFDAFECLRVPAGQWDKSAFWVTGYQGFLESLLAKKNMRLAKPLSYPLSIAGFLKDAFVGKRLPTSDVEVKTCSSFDDRLDDFWETLKRKNPHILLAIRSREVLEWHFKYALAKNRLWIVTAADGSRLAGYAIFDRKDNVNLGLKRVRLVDFQSLDGTATLLAPMLSWALRRCREEGIHMLENVGSWLEPGEFIDNFAPHSRKLSTWTYVYRASGSQLKESLSSRQVWSPSLFDATGSL